MKVELEAKLRVQRLSCERYIFVDERLSDAHILLVKRAADRGQATSIKEIDCFLLVSRFGRLDESRYRFLSFPVPVRGRLRQLRSLAVTIGAAGGSRLGRGTSPHLWSPVRACQRCKEPDGCRRAAAPGPASPQEDADGSWQHPQMLHALLHTAEGQTFVPDKLPKSLSRGRRDVLGL